MKTILAYLLLVSSVFAQTKAATISGPSQANVGTLVELRASSDVAASMTWLTVSDAVYKTYESGTVLAFASPKPGRFEFALVVVVVTSEGKPVVSIEKHSVEVTGGGPQPGPNPPVPPQPQPDRFKALREACRLAPQDKRSEIKANYRTIATMVVAGTIVTAEQLQSETSQRNRGVLGEVNESHPWYPFAVAMSRELKALADAGLMRTKDDWAATWNAIAESL